MTMTVMQIRQMAVLVHLPRVFMGVAMLSINRRFVGMVVVAVAVIVAVFVFRLLMGVLMLMPLKGREIRAYNHHGKRD